MAVNKLDITMMEDVGTSASQLLQRDGSGNLPAVDGSQVTGIDPGFSTSTSDPVITTNPSGGVGSLWYNTTSGEMYVCTDATAGANVWTNVGAGSGDVAPWAWPGESYGFTAGGQQSGNPSYDRIDKFPFASDSNATDVANLYIAQRLAGGASSGDGYGLHMGGKTSSNTNIDIIHKYNQIAGTDSVDHGDLSAAQNMGVAGVSDTGASYGYAAGGTSSPFTKGKDKIAFSSNTTATDIGALSVHRGEVGGANDSTHGYCLGGVNSSYGSTYDVIDRWVFASGGVSVDVGNLTQHRTISSYTSSSTHGYGAGGYATGGPAIVNIIDKFAFAASGNATDVGDLSTGVTQGGAGQSSATYGYNVGGQPPATKNNIEKYSFTTDGSSTDIADLTLARVYPSGTQY